MPNEIPKAGPPSAEGRREAARYLRDLADRLLNYPMDAYKEAYEALLACASDEENAALAASPRAPGGEPPPSHEEVNLVATIVERAQRELQKQEESLGEVAQWLRRSPAPGGGAWQPIVD